MNFPYEISMLQNLVMPDSLLDDWTTAGSMIDFKRAGEMPAGNETSELRERRAKPELSLTHP
jgi:hypothetical protein